MLRPGRSAVVAAIDEESTDPVNARMTAFGGSVLRRDLSDVWDSEYEQDVAAIETDIARTKAEYAVSRAARRAKLQARIDALNDKLHQALDRAKAKREDIGRQTAAKVEHLKAERQAR